MEIDRKNLVFQNSYATKKPYYSTTQPSISEILCFLVTTRQVLQLAPSSFSEFESAFFGQNSPSQLQGHLSANKNSLGDRSIPPPFATYKSGDCSTHPPTAKNIRLATSHAGFGWCETLAKRSVFVINDFSRLRGRKRCVRSVELIQFRSSLAVLQ